MSPYERIQPVGADASTNKARDIEIPHVVVVDPAFDSYKSLAASARAGKMVLHFRSSGADALKLAGRHRVDAWLVAADLDDMSGFDFIELLRAQHGLERSPGPKCVAMVGDRSGDPTVWQALEAGADHTATKPITFRSLEQLLGMTHEQRKSSLLEHHAARTFLAVPIGVGAAIVSIAVILLN